jgi:hypothetical protein
LGLFAKANDETKMTSVNRIFAIFILPPVE